MSTISLQPLTHTIQAQGAPPFARQLFIAWVPFQRRAVAMQPEFGYALHHVGPSFRWRSLRPLEYLLKALQTLGLLIRHRPEVLWIQLPPAPLLYLAFLYQQLVQPHLKLIADCHNATFRQPWIQFPAVVRLLNRCDQVVVHNPFVEAQALALGIQPEKLVVLRDRTLSPASAQLPRPWALVPCSFNSDEPIAELLVAARQAPEITFVLTGNTARAVGRHDLSQVPANIRLPGFVSETDFNDLLAQADMVVGLTKLEGIQLSVANEAVSYGKPMVLSDTQLLRKFFYQGAVYVDPLDGGAIAAGCRTALAHTDQLKIEVIALKQDIDQEWHRQAAPLQAILGLSTS